MSRISPPPDYVKCEICGTHRPESKVRRIKKFEVDGVTTVEIFSFVCADDSEKRDADPNHPLSTFCAMNRPKKTEEEAP